MVMPYIRQITNLYPNSHKMARAEKLSSADTCRSIPGMHIICESKSAIHRLCYNMPFGGSFVGSSKTSSVPRPFCSSLYVWTGLVSHSIRN